MFDRDKSKGRALTPELSALERQLAALAVSPLQIDRDRLMFEAGRAAERGSEAVHRQGVPQWIWPASTAMMTAACLALSAMLVWTRGPVIVAADHDREIRGSEGESIRSPAESQAIDPPNAQDLREVERFVFRNSGRQTAAPGYLGLRYVALTHGLNSLDAGRTSLSPADSSSDNDVFRPDDPTTVRQLYRELLPETRASDRRSQI